MDDDFEIISPDDVKNESASFNILIFKQIERINDCWSKVLTSKPFDRKLSMAELFFSIRALESIMWVRLNRDKAYMEKREKLGIKDPSSFTFLSTNELSGMLKFSDILDKWYKLITNRLDRFNFFPAIDLYDFQSTKDLEKMY